MHRILALAALLLATSAQATDYGSVHVPYNGKQLLVGQQTDTFEFTVPSAQVTITVKPFGTENIGCSTRYCQSPGSYHASISSVRLLGADGSVQVLRVGTTSGLHLSGAYTLEVMGVGYGTGTAASEGHYSVGVSAAVVSAGD